MRLIDADKIPYHKQLEAQGNGQYEDVEVAYKSDIDAAPTVDAVSKDLFEQYKWERDTALETLEEHGLSLGQKKE